MSCLLLGTLLLIPCCGHAVECPKQPEQSRQDWDVEVQAAVGKIGPVTGAELVTRTRSTTRDLLGRLPQADKVYLEQMMYATYCSALRDDATLSESQKSARIKAYNLEVRKTLAGTDSDAAHPPPGPSSAESARAELARIPLPYTAAALGDSAEEGNLKAVKLFLAAGMDPNGRDSDGVTALMRAAGSGHVEIVQALLKGKANVNQMNEGGGTALSWAATGGHPDVVRVLLAHGVDQKTIPDAVVGAATSCHLDVLQVLAGRGLERAIVNEALVRAVGSTTSGVTESCLSDVVRFLLAQGAEIDTPGDDDAGEGWTPLLRVADAERPQVARLLLDAGAAINATCNCKGYLGGGWNALMIAVHRSNQAIADLLLARGADPNLANHDGNTALMLAAENRSADLARALLDHGAKVNATNTDGRTALMFAATHGVENVPLLLSRGADANARDAHGETALMRAATAYGSPENLSALLDAGADIRAKSTTGVTALMRAAAVGRGDLVRVLIRRGADVAAKDEDDKTAQDYAEDNLKEDDSASGRESLRLLKKAAKP